MMLVGIFRTTIGGSRLSFANVLRPRARLATSPLEASPCPTCTEPIAMHIHHIAGSLITDARHVRNFVYLGQSGFRSLRVADNVGVKTWPYRVTG